MLVGDGVVQLKGGRFKMPVGGVSSLICSLQYNGCFQRGPPRAMRNPEMDSHAAVDLQSPCQSAGTGEGSVPKRGS